jgi:hypothetical protein
LTSLDACLTAFSSVSAGVGGLALAALLIWYLLRRRRIQSEFDGNFDPAHVSGAGGLGGAGGGGTLPQIDVDEDDDGMGGRLNGGVGGGGIISPYPFTAPQEMTHSNISAAPLMAGAALGAGAGYAGGQYAHSHSRRPSEGASSHYQSTMAGTGSGTGPSSHGHQAFSDGGYSTGGPSPMSPTGTAGPQSSSEHSSSGYGPAAGMMAAGAAAGGAAGAYYGSHNQNSRFSNPRSAKEMEALRMRNAGAHVMNPDSEYPPENGGASTAHPNAHPSEQARQSYLQYGPNNGGAVPTALQPGRPQSMSTSQSHSYAGSNVIVHRDGGRVELPRKGQEASQDEEEQQMPTEIPPTYDSLLQGQGKGQQQQRRTDSE